MMIDYSAEIVGDQVVFLLNSYTNPPFDFYQSDDGFLSITVVHGKYDGWIGYGELHIYLCTDCVPMVLRTPHYEHEQDLLDVMERIHRNMEELNNGY